MRLRPFAVLAALFMVAACQLALPGGDTPASPAGVDDITVTPLDAPPAATPGAVAEAPAAANPSPPEPASAEPASPEPAPAASAEAVPAEPEAAPVAKGPAQIACERKGGRYGVAGKSGALTCVRPTRDGGKRCTREGDCEGLCLARSQSCAPIKPLFGCNDILQGDGRRVTLCID